MIGQHTNRVLLDAFVRWTNDQFPGAVEVIGLVVFTRDPEAITLEQFLVTLFTGFVGGWEAHDAK